MGGRGHAGGVGEFPWFAGLLRNGRRGISGGSAVGGRRAAGPQGARAGRNGSDRRAGAAPRTYKAPTMRSVHHWLNCQIGFSSVHRRPLWKERDWRPRQVASHASMS